MLLRQETQELLATKTEPMVLFAGYYEGMYEHHLVGAIGETTSTIDDRGYNF